MSKLEYLLAVNPETKEDSPKANSVLVQQAEALLSSPHSSFRDTVLAGTEIA